MTKYEIMVMIMCDANRFAGHPFTVTAKLAACLEALCDRLSDEDLAELIQIGGAMYQYGMVEYNQPAQLEDLFSACENWPVPGPLRNIHDRKHEQQRGRSLHGFGDRNASRRRMSSRLTSNEPAANYRLW